MIGEENRMRSEMAIMSNPALRDVLIKKNQETEVTPQEELLFLVFQSTEINSWHATWLEYQADLIDIEGYIERWRDLYKYQGYSERWNSTKHRYSPGFVTWMEENVVNN